MEQPIQVRSVGTFRADDEIGRGIESCWLDVSNAGGAVGFPFPPVARDGVRAATQRLAEDVAKGSVRLFLAECDGEVVGWVVLRLNSSKIASHWGSVERLQSRPELRGLGIGSCLLEALIGDARSDGIEHLRLVLRSGEDLEAFYESRGWVEVGRHPHALRLSPGDDRDEVSMVLDLAHEGASAHCGCAGDEGG